MRREGWEIRLSKAMTEGLRKPHAWGENDCVTFAADCVKAITGQDPVSDLRGTYDSPEGAARIMIALGYKNLGDCIASRLPEIDPSQARRGDVVLCWGDEHEFAAVVERHTAVGAGPEGAVHIPLIQVQRAFRIG